MATTPIACVTVPPVVVGVGFVVVPAGGAKFFKIYYQSIILFYMT